MEVQVIENAQILIPNKEHENFTESSKVIKKGTILLGDEILIKGKRRGEGFTYKLFKTNNNQLIYLKKIKPMQVTEVTLSASGDAATSNVTTPTVISVPSGKKLLTKNVIIGTILGAGVGYGFSKYKKLDKKTTMMYSVVGAIVGFGISKYVEKRKSIVVKPSK
jgi:hypothetical protein